MAFNDWLGRISNSDDILYLKRLSANDTGATGGHQVGIYTPSPIINSLFPELDRKDILNPSILLAAKTVSHDFSCQEAKVIYYNNRFFGGTRNEKRITRWGGKGSPLQNHENTGAIAIFAFSSINKQLIDTVEVWVCTYQEEKVLESMIGEVAPGLSFFGSYSQIFSGVPICQTRKNSLETISIPELWEKVFPSGAELINYLSEVITFKNKNPDKLLLERRDAEFLIFKRVEELHVIDKIKAGFNSVDDFIYLANSVSNRRKSRSGRSLELHLEQIFIDNGLTCFSTQAVTERNKKPDFLFPSEEAYQDKNWNEKELRMLAVKTTCKDRWRQILNEANRIKKIHLFTLQEGVSENQFMEMQDSNVVLVVPEPLHNKYPSAIRNKIMTLQEFINEMKLLFVG